MADEADRGSAREEEWRGDALASWRRRWAGEHGPGLAACEACGEAIPAARRRAVPGCTRCVGCQAEAEGRR